MRLKSFFANSIEEAIRLARQELGPDAMLVNSKRTGVEAKHLGQYEVVVCAETPDSDPEGVLQPDKYRQDHAPVHGNTGNSLPVDKLSQDVSDLKQQMEKLALTLARSENGVGSVAFSPDLSRAFTTLTDAELDTEIAYDVVEKLSSPVPVGALRAELAKRVNIDSGLDSTGAVAHVVALVGPPGTGKTSALVKLAVQHGLAKGKTVQFLTTDTYRIAAADELRSYAAILGIGCQVLDSVADLDRALNEHRQKDLIFIDTPGLCRAEMDASDDLAKVLARREGIDKHLVLAASMRTSDLRRAAEQYRVFEPQKLLFTRIDETETFGPVLSLSIRSGKPLSFFSRGQRIPEDLDPANSDQLINLILHSHERREPKFGVVAA